MKPVVILITVLLLPLSANAAVAFDTASMVINSAASSPAYGTITLGGSDTAICVGNAGAVSGTDSVTNVQIGTASGTSTATKMGGVQKPSDRHQDLWCLLNPPTGTVTVRVDFTGTYETAIAAGYSGVLAIDAAHTASGGSSSTFSDTTTPLRTGAWVFGVSGSSNADPTGGANTFGRANCSGCGMLLSDNNLAISPAAATTLAWNVAVPGTWASTMVALEATAAPATASSVYYWSYWW